MVSEGSIGTRADHDVSLILAALSGGGDGSAPVTLDGAHAARVERSAPPDPAHGVDHGARHVDYAALVPGSADRWLVFAFSALGAGDPGDEVAGVLVGLFDAIMSTFRWTWAEEPDGQQGIRE